VVAHLWSKKVAVVVLVVAFTALVVAPAPLWLRLVGIAAAIACYWRYAWKYDGIRERTLEAIDRERRRQRRPPQE